MEAHVSQQSRPSRCSNWLVEKRHQIIVSAAGSLPSALLVPKIWLARKSDVLPTRARLTVGGASGFAILRAARAAAAPDGKGKGKGKVGKLDVTSAKASSQTPSAARTTVASSSARWTCSSASKGSLVYTFPSFYRVRHSSVQGSHSTRHVSGKSSPSFLLTAAT